MVPEKIGHSQHQLLVLVPYHHFGAGESGIIGIGVLCYCSP
jgi:hypothetical protein